MISYLELRTDNLPQPARSAGGFAIYYKSPHGHKLPKLTKTKVRNPDSVILLYLYNLNIY